MKNCLMRTVKIHIMYTTLIRFLLNIHYDNFGPDIRQHILTRDVKSSNIDENLETLLLKPLEVNHDGD